MPGLPYLEVEFTHRVDEAIRRRDQGVVALLLHDKSVKGSFELVSEEEIPKELSQRNQEQIRLAMIGNLTKPKKVVVVVEQITAEGDEEPVLSINTESEGFKFLETARFDYLAIPFIEAADTQKVVTWIDKFEKKLRKNVKVVLPNTKADNKRVINYATETVKDHSKTYQTKEYCARIAGLLTGTPLTSSATYAVLPELVECTNLSLDEINKRIEGGEFLLINDGTKIKVARGVNSLVTPKERYEESFKKIKILDIADTMDQEVRLIVEDRYIGKYPNTYDNKILLISTIHDYYKALGQANIIDAGSISVDIDVAAQKEYLRKQNYKTVDGRSVESMDEEEIRHAYTDDKVFLFAKYEMVDAIEEIKLKIEI